MAAVEPLSAEPPAPIPIRAKVSTRQQQLIDSPARFLFIGAGTKTGKTVACELRAARCILAGKPVAWSGSVLAKTKKTYRRLKQILAKPIEAGTLKVNDGTGTIYDFNDNPLFVSFTGEHPEAIFGDGFALFVIDEASRQPRAVFDAAVTTTSVMRGAIVCAFNLDHGARNWVIKELLAVERMSPEQRRQTSKDFMMFPTASEPFVDPQTIEEARTSGMPRVLFEALYEAKIPADDVSLFSNLDVIWTGPAPRAPDRGHTYIMGVDLGRKRDYTVASVFDVTQRRFAAAIRLYKVGWTMQYERVSQLYKTWRCCKAWVDQTGLGDPVVEELEERGMSVEGFMFTEPSKKALIEGASAACDAKSFTVPDTDDFKAHRGELMSFEIVVSKNVQGKIMYKVPDGESNHDDAAFSLMLALFGADQGNFGSPRIEPMNRSAPLPEDDGIDLDIGGLEDRDYSGY